MNLIRDDSSAFGLIDPRTPEQENRDDPGGFRNNSPIVGEAHQQDSNSWSKIRPPVLYRAKFFSSQSELLFLKGMS